MNKSSVLQSRIWMIASFALLVVLIVYMVIFPPKKAAADDPAVAKVNGVSIAKSTLYDALVEAGGSQTLDSLISEELVKQESKKAGIEVTEADLTKEIESIKKSFGSEEQFTQALATYNMTLDQLKKSMHTQVELRKLLEPQVKVSDDDIKKYYDENLESLKTPEKVKASHILVATKEEAEAIAADLKNGGDFAAIAKEKSTDTSNKDKGGDLGFFGKGQMDEAFETAAFALKVGETSGVVQSSFGYHIIKATDHTDAVTPTLEAKKEEIRETLVTQQISTLSSSWIQEKKAAATVESLL